MTLTLDQVVLRPLEQKDIAQLHVYRNDPDVTGSLGGFSTGYSHADLTDWLDFHRRQRNEVMWCIADAASDECLGHIGLYDIDHRVRKAELAILIGGKNYRGKGIGKAVCQAVIDYAQRQLNLRRIELSLLASNETAHNMYKKLGFVEEGVQRDAQFRDGQYVSVILMALLTSAPNDG